MTGKAIRRYQMLVRVSRFGVERATSFPAETIAARAFADVQAVVDALAQHGLAQASARGRDKVHEKGDARRSLRETLRAIGRTARAMALESPGLDGRFRVPKSNGDHALLTFARVVHREAGCLAGEFIAHGLPPTFLGDLAARINALEQAGVDYVAVKDAGVAATAGIDAVLVRASRSLRRLDAVVANVCRGDQPALAVWRLARRVGQAPIRLVPNVA